MFSSPPASRHLSQKALLDLSSSVSRRSLIFGTKGTAEKIAANVASAKLNRRVSPRFGKSHTLQEMNDIDSPMSSIAAEGKGLFFGSGSVPYDKPAIFQKTEEKEEKVSSSTMVSSVHSLGFLFLLFFISVLLRSLNQHHDQMQLVKHQPSFHDSFSPLSTVVEAVESRIKTNVSNVKVVLPWKKMNKTTETILLVQPILEPVITISTETLPETAINVQKTETSLPATTLLERDREGRLVLGRSYDIESEILPPITAEILSSSDPKKGGIQYHISVDVSRIRLHPLHSRLCAAISASPSSPPSFSSCMTASSSQLFWASSLGKTGPHKLAVAFNIDNLKVDGGAFTVIVSIMDMRGKTEKISITVTVTEPIESISQNKNQTSNTRKLSSISATW